ncbi:MAG: acyl-CoA dehydrogenase [Gammaproteobacteria bacterium]
MSFIVSRRDLDFYLYEFLQTEQMFRTERYSDYDRDTVTAMLDAAQAIAEQEFYPLAALLDANEPEFKNGQVTVIPEVRKALDAYKESGFLSAGFDHDVGGMQLPWVVHQAICGLFLCANTALAGYQFLTAANANLLNTCGSDELKQRFLQPLLEGRWFGTMCLSETQAGSSLGDIRTKAEPLENGTYNVTGSKMWISGGDHDLTENIVHMVLARIPGAPEGVRGISLFLVPKVRVEDDGSLGQPNNVAAAGLNHKMGHRGTTNCLLNFGESGVCEGFLVGKENEGLANMFHMMNEARIGVGLGAVMSGLGGYLYSLDYARERRQGRLRGNKDPKSPQVRLIEHADVRRLLLSQKAWVEGGQALIYYCASLIDRQKVAVEKPEQQALHLLLELLTPVAKSWPSEFCLEANKNAIQVLGGYGYTREYPVERFYRDNRLNPIHEGAHAIHGIDILGRKVRMYDGAAVKVLINEMQPALNDAGASANFSGLAKALTRALEMTQECIAAVGDCHDHEQGLANATIFLDAFGHVVVAWLWLRQALVSDQTSAGVGADFYAGKMAACHYFFNYELPKAMAQFELVNKLDRTTLDVREEHFLGH